MSEVAELLWMIPAAAGWAGYLLMRALSGNASRVPVFHPHFGYGTGGGESGAPVAILHDAALRSFPGRLNDLYILYIKSSETAHLAGFADLSYFNRAFRSRFDTTPSDLRASASERGPKQ